MAKPNYSKRHSKHFLFSNCSSEKIRLGISCESPLDDSHEMSSHIFFFFFFFFFNSDTVAWFWNGQCYSTIVQGMYQGYLSQGVPLSTQYRNNTDIIGIRSIKLRLLSNNKSFCDLSDEGRKVRVFRHLLVSIYSLCFDLNIYHFDFHFSCNKYFTQEQILRDWTDINMLIRLPFTTTTTTTTTTKTTRTTTKKNNNKY